MVFSISVENVPHLIAAKIVKLFWFDSSLHSKCPFKTKYCSLFKSKIKWEVLKNEMNPGRFDLSKGYRLILIHFSYLIAFHFQINSQPFELNIFLLNIDPKLWQSESNTPKKKFSSSGFAILISNSKSYIILHHHIILKP